MCACSAETRLPEFVSPLAKPPAVPSTSVAVVKSSMAPMEPQPMRLAGVFGSCTTTERKSTGRWPEREKPGMTWFMICTTPFESVAPYVTPVQGSDPIPS